MSNGGGDERHDGAVHEFWSRVAAVQDAVVVYVGDPRGEEIAHDVAAVHEAMTQELLEYIDNHETVFFMTKRTFAVGCRDHAQAKAIFTRGKIPAGFRCSLRGEECPMRTLSRAEGGRALSFLQVLHSRGP